MPPQRTARFSDVLAGGTATVGACIFSNPVEVVKTRMQLQGELQGATARGARMFRNPFQAFVLIFRNEGLAGIQKGLAPACLYQFSMNGVRLGSYGFIKEQYDQILPWDAADHPLPCRVLAGATAGAIGAVTGRYYALFSIPNSPY